MQVLKVLHSMSHEVTISSLLSMQPAGEGLLQQQFTGNLKQNFQLKACLLKSIKANSYFIKTVGIITSSSGAALQDILHDTQRRDPSLSVVIYPALVQGKEATQDIVNMIERWQTAAMV